jgi:hypothetical protein
MAFPIVALIAAAASDMQQRAQHGDNIAEAARAQQDRINRTRVQQLGGQPYGMMAQDFQNQLGMMDRQADQSRNNNIGALLQAYLTSSIGNSGNEKYGGDYAKQLGQNPGEGGFGAGNVMGKAQLDPWDRDPWGDAGF